MKTLQRPDQPYGRVHKPEPAVGVAQCPYCGQSITRQEYKEIQARIEAEERARIAKVEADLKARVAAEVAKAKNDSTAAIAKAVQAAEKRVKEMKAGQEEVIAQRLTAQRHTLAKQSDEKLTGERIAHAAEKARLESALADLQRKLAAKPAHLIGEPAEIDLFGALQKAFPEDRIRRIKKGQKGPDVVLEVVLNGNIAGSFVLDSKAHSRWSNGFVTKLRADQISYGADFAVLVSAVFPAGAQELHLRDHVIIASPARVVAVIQLLRRHIVEVYRLRLTGNARNEKAEAMLTFITSRDATDLFDRLDKLADDLSNLEAREVDQHRTVWRRRDELIRTLRTTHDDIVAGIDRIIDDTQSVPPEASV